MMMMMRSQKESHITKSCVEKSHRYRCYYSFFARRSASREEEEEEEEPSGAAAAETKVCS